MDTEIRPSMYDDLITTINLQFELPKITNLVDENKSTEGLIVFRVKTMEKSHIVSFSPNAFCIEFWDIARLKFEKPHDEIKSISCNRKILSPKQTLKEAGFKVSKEYTIIISCYC